MDLFFAEKEVLPRRENPSILSNLVLTILRFEQLGTDEWLNGGSRQLNPSDFVQLSIYQ